MANLIATEAYAKSVGGKNISYTSNLCCTKSRAIDLGCKVLGTYAYNQLVCQKDLSTPANTYTFNCNITYSSSQSKSRFYIISDSTLIGTKNYIDASTSVNCQLITTFLTTLTFMGNKYVNNSGTFIMESGKTYYILYVPIGGSYPDGNKLPPGTMQSNWASAGYFTFSSTKYDYNINLSVS